MKERLRIEMEERRTAHIMNYLEQYFDEVEPMEFYRDLFPVGSFEKKGEYLKGKYNGILREVTNEFRTNKKTKKTKRVVRRYTLTDDLENLKEVIERNKDEFVVLPPISYAGKSATQTNARELYALAIDLDGINVKELGDKTDGMKGLCEKIDKRASLPEPSYIVMSGTGLHIYYMLETPVKLYPAILDEITKLKTALTYKLWYGDVSYLDRKVQIEPVVQPFRAVGTVTKKGTKVRAFAYNEGKKVSINYLNTFVNEKDRANLDVKHYKSKLCLEEAKKNYPQWYENRIVQKKKRGHWQFNRGMYESWLEELRNPDPNHIYFGARYWAIFTLAVTGMKCGIPFAEVERDSYSLVPTLNDLSDNAFTEEDVVSALKGYSEEYYTLSVDWINAKFNGILKKTKRNHREQKIHLERIRKLQEIDYPNGEWRNTKGQPLKRDIVAAWRKENPLGRKVDCHKETKLSRVTINKYWDYHNTESM